MLKRLALTTLLVFGVLSNAIGAPLTTTYVSRAAFETNLGTIVTDGYESPGYLSYIACNGCAAILTDAQMSAALGETKYTSTAYPDHNGLWGFPNHFYCAGCNGSYRMDFTLTSVSAADGVYGVGLDYFTQGTPTYAFITFGDNSTLDFLLDDATLPTTRFFGITSDLLVKTIHMGVVPNGAASTSGYWGQDNLTIGDKATVPEPAVLGLFGLGLIGLVASRRRKQ